MVVSEQPQRTSAPAPPDADVVAPAADHTRLDAVDPSPPPSKLNTPLGADDRIGGRYRLVCPIAAGGMATVWRAVDEVLTRPVAIKILHAHLAADPDFVARFRREAVAAARLAHPSIVAIYDTCADPEAIVMELVEGRTLREELDERRFLPPAEAASIAAGIAHALEVAHKAGLVHRDVKPANVLLAPDGHLKVADFGIAKAARPDDHPDLPDLTSVGLMVGTAKYLAPEQVSGGPIDARTDVYALGAVLYEMLCGRPPFTGSNDLATATARLHAVPARPRTVLRTIPPVLDAIVMRAMATDPSERYPSASALWADLQNVADRDEPNPVERVTDATAVVGRQPSFARSERSWLVPASLVSLVAVALGLAWLLIGGTDARRDFIDLVDRVSPGGRTAAADPIAPVSMTASAFDPLGDGREHDDEANAAVDGDPGTGWTTERYESRDFGGLKPGVGLVIDLGESTDVETLQVETPNAGWSLVVHVADQPATALDGWGPPAATVEMADGSTTIELDRARGSFVLIWLTDLGTDGRVKFDLREVRVNAP